MGRGTPYYDFNPTFKTVSKKKGQARELSLAAGCWTREALQTSQADILEYGQNGDDIGHDRYGPVPDRGQGDQIGKQDNDAARHPQGIQ